MDEDEAIPKKEAAQARQYARASLPMQAGGNQQSCGEGHLSTLTGIL